MTSDTRSRVRAAATARAGLTALGALGAVIIGCAPEIRPGAEASADGDDGAAERAAPSSPVRRAPVPAVAGRAAAEPGGSTEPAYTMVTVRSGAELEIELIDPLRPSELQPGDTLRFGVTRPVIENDMVMVPLNSLVKGEITAVEAAAGNGEGDGGDALVTVRFVDVFFNGNSWPMTASVVEVMPRPGTSPPAGSARMTLGRVLAAGREDAISGAAAGAAGGSAILLPADGSEPGLPVGTILRLRLDEPFVFGLPSI